MTMIISSIKLKEKKSKQTVSGLWTRAHSVLFGSRKKVNLQISYFSATITKPSVQRGWYTFTKVKEVPIIEQIIMVWHIRSKFAKKVGSIR